MKTNFFQSNLKFLKRNKNSFFLKDFLLTWDWSDKDIRALLALAENLKELHSTGKSIRIFDSGLAIAIFRDKSTRTRFSFASAANALGLGLADLDEEK